MMSSRASGLLLTVACRICYPLRSFSTGILLNILENLFQKLLCKWNVFHCIVSKEGRKDLLTCFFPSPFFLILVISSCNRFVNWFELSKLAWGYFCEDLYTQTVFCDNDKSLRFSLLTLWASVIFGGNDNNLSFSLLTSFALVIAGRRRLWCIFQALWNVQLSPEFFSINTSAQIIADQEARLRSRSW